MNILLSMSQSVQKIFFNTELYENLEKMGDVVINKGDNYTKDDIKDKLLNTDIIITGWGHEKLTADIVGERLKLIVHVGGTVGPIVDQSIYERGIKVVSANQIFAKSVAEGVLSYILFELKNLGYFSNKLKSGIWTDNADLTTRSLHGKKVGIISIGNISKYLLLLLKPFDIDTYVYSTKKDEKLQNEFNYKYETLEEIFKACDIISVHTAANENTKNMIDEKLLSSIKKGGVFINTARASVVDENALVKVLQKGEISAVLDVYSTEPLPKNSPYLSMDNVTLFPHMAGPASDIKQYITQQMMMQIEAYKNNLPLIYEISLQTAKTMTQTS